MVFATRPSQKFDSARYYLVFVAVVLHLVAAGCFDNETCPGGGCTGGALVSGAPNFYVGTQEESYYGEQWQNLTDHVLQLINVEDIR